VVVGARVVVGEAACCVVGAACCVVGAGLFPPICIGMPIGFKLRIGPFCDPVPPIAAPTPRGFRSMIGAGAACVVAGACVVVV